MPRSRSTSAVKSLPSENKTSTEAMSGLPSVSTTKSTHTRPSRLWASSADEVPEDRPPPQPWRLEHYSGHRIESWRRPSQRAPLGHGREGIEQRLDSFGARGDTPDAVSGGIVPHYDKVGAGGEGWVIPDLQLASVVEKREGRSHHSAALEVQPFDRVHQGKNPLRPPPGCCRIETCFRDAGNGTSWTRHGIGGEQMDSLRGVATDEVLDGKPGDSNRNWPLRWQRLRQQRPPR